MLVYFSKLVITLNRGSNQIFYEARMPSYTGCTEVLPTCSVNRASEQLFYDEQNLIGQEFVTLEFVIDNRDPLLEQTQYLVVLTSDQARQQQVKVADPRKEYAKVRGHVIPATPDIMATASETGTIILEGTALTILNRIAQPSEQIYIPSAIPEKKNPAIPVINTQEISREYLCLVKASLDNGEIASAMKQRQQIRKLYAELQNKFTSLYGKPTSEIKVPEKAEQSDSLEQKIQSSYNHQLAVFMKQGDAQSALSLIDKVESLSGHINTLF